MAEVSGKSSCSSQPSSSEFLRRSESNSSSSCERISQLVSAESKITPSLSSSLSSSSSLARWDALRSRGETKPVIICTPSAWTFSLVFLLLGLLLLTGHSAAEPQLQCLKGTSGFPGDTFPKGDIFLKEGDTLEVYCRLNLTLSKGFNASFIQFIITKSNVSRDLMRTTVINETTALLHVEKLNASRLHLSCEIVPPNSSPSEHRQVCSNEVIVGYPPLPVENFRCIAPHWRSLNCTWTKPFNYVSTNYELTHIHMIQRRHEAVRRCPIFTPTFCSWGRYSEPPYLPNLKNIILRMNGTNPLNTSGVTWTFEIDHFAIIVPEAPKVVETSLVQNLTNPSSNTTIQWKFPEFKDFYPGLFHKITVCVQNITQIPCNTTTLQSTKGVDSMMFSPKIEYPYVNYTVEIRMRSQKAKDEEDLWSDPTVVLVTSEPTVPSVPPKVNAGSFESIATSLQHRDVYIYWEQVPFLQHNGPNLHYALTVYQLDGLQPLEIQPKEITHSYAKFSPVETTKSYSFHVRSVNDVGSSPTVSKVEVPEVNKVPTQPKSVSQLDFGNGTFEVSWIPQSSKNPIVSYTVFRCRSTKPRPYQCQGLVEWDVVSSTKRARRVYLPRHNDTIYQFAVSANSENASSGMVWASCTLLHNKVPDKLKTIRATKEAETEIHIEWQLDCSYQEGVIDSFKITYCLVETTSPGECIDNETSAAVQGAQKTTYTLKELKPYSKYKIAVSVLTHAGESPKSDPIYSQTKEGVPSSPSIVRATTLSNVTAVISIWPPKDLNGIIRKYEIKYKNMEATDAAGRKEQSAFVTVYIHASSATPKITEVELKSLESNSNYSYSVIACTTQDLCSKETDPQYFQTKIGSTKMKSYPNLTVEQDQLLVEFNLPDHVGGPIKYFEILEKHNGKLGDIVSVDFTPGTVEYRKGIKFSCSSDTNLTAQVRAVTQLEDGGLIYGDWSPPGNFNCSGGAGWLLWLTIVITAGLFLAIIGAASTKIYQHLKSMKNFDIKVPPGMQVSDLNGFSHRHPKRMRKNSDEDTHSFGKEDQTYQLQMTSTHGSEESKDFLSLTESSLREKEKPVKELTNELPEDFTYDNKVYSEDVLESNHESPVVGNPPAPNVVGTSFPSSQTSSSPCPPETVLESKPQEPRLNSSRIPLNNMSEFEHSSTHGNSQDGPDRKRNSPSPTNRLLEETNLTEDEETLQSYMLDERRSHIPPTPPSSTHRGKTYANGPVVISNPLDMDTDSLLGDSKAQKIKVDPPGPSPIFSSSSKAAHNIPDVLSTSASSTSPFPSTSNGCARNGINSYSNNPVTVGNSAPPTPPVVAPVPAPSSSYVKWTQLMPDQLRNGDAPSPLGDSGRRTPYCQVGILLDSN